MERYEEMGVNSINNVMSMTATDMFEYRKFQEDTGLRNSIQRKMGIIDSYYDSKRMMQLHTDKIKRHKESPHVLHAHLQPNYP